MTDTSIPDYNGNIYPHEDGRIAGWLADLNALDRAVEFELWLDGQSLGVFKADQSRPSLRRRGLGHGNYGFDVQIADRPLRPESWIALRPLTEMAPVLQRNERGGRPSGAAAPAARPGEAPSHTPDYDGNIYPHEDGRISGWLADLNALDRAVEFELWLDGQSLGVFKADQSRPSLRRRGLGHGNYGFDVQIADRPLRPESWIALRPLTEIVPVLQRNERKGSGRALRSGASVEDLVSLAAGLEEADLAVLMARLMQKLLRPRIRARFRTQQWVEMNGLAATLLSAGAMDPALFALLGRGALYNRDFATARVYFDMARGLDPLSVEITFYRGMTELCDRQAEKAVALLQEAAQAAPGDPRFLAELCNALRLKLTRQAGDPALIAETVARCRQLLAMDTSPRSLSAAGQALLQAGAHAEALQVMEDALLSDPDSVELLHIKSRALISLDRVAEALEVADHVLRLAPNNQTALFQKRTLGDLAASGSERRLPEFGYLHLSDAEEGDLVRLLAQRSEDWLILNAGAESGRDPALLDPVLLDRLVDPFLGHQIVDTGAGPVELWRRSVLINLLEAGLIGPALEGLDRFRPLYGSASPPAQPRRALLISSYGAYKFGGGEHFIESMAGHYRTRGYEPVIVGYLPHLRGESGVTPAGFRYTFIEKRRSALLRLIVEEEVSLIHAVSGAGFLAAEATDHTPIRLIYGIHYWREFLGAEGDERYFDAEGAPIPRLEFRYILSRASAVYANSDFTRHLLEQTFGVRAPVVYSVPADHGEEGQP